MLHLTRVAFGANDIAALRHRIATNHVGGLLRLNTRYRPKRHEEVVGGSLFFIIKHRLVGRCEVVEFEEAEGGRTHIVLKAALIPVDPVARRAHQGWRYMEAKDAPRDLGEAASGAEFLPANLAEALADAALL